MKANEFKFKVTNKNGVSAIISLADIGGYDGCWIISSDIRNELYCAEIDDELDFEHINNEGDI